MSSLCKSWEFAKTYRLYCDSSFILVIWIFNFGVFTAKFNHVNKGLEIGRGVGKQQRVRGREWPGRYELPEMVRRMLYCVNPNAHVVRSTQRYLAYKIGMVRILRSSFDVSFHTSSKRFFKVQWLIKIRWIESISRKKWSRIRKKSAENPFREFKDLTCPRIIKMASTRETQYSCDRLPKMCPCWYYEVNHHRLK